MSDFEVKVPATIANLGPGFDCLGMAIDIWNSVTVQSMSILPAHPKNLSLLKINVTHNNDEK